MPDATDTITDAPWYTPTILVKLAGGEHLITSGKPVQRAPGPQVARWTGISQSTLRHLSDAGFIRCSKISPSKLLYYPGEVEDFIAQTEADPDFWNEVRKKAYLTAKRLRDKGR